MDVSNPFNSLIMVLISGPKSAPTSRLLTLHHSSIRWRRSFSEFVNSAALLKGLFGKGKTFWY